MQFIDKDGRGTVRLLVEMIIADSEQLPFRIFPLQTDHPLRRTAPNLLDPVTLTRHISRSNMF